MLILLFFNFDEEREKENLPYSFNETLFIFSFLVNYRLNLSAFICCRTVQIFVLFRV
jgi:hypothetical protein